MAISVGQLSTVHECLPAFGLVPRCDIIVVWEVVDRSTV
jgi:hypothetical protein